MTPATTAETQPQQTPLDRAKARVHDLLRRSIRIVTPRTPEEDEQRKRELARLDTDAQAYHEWREIEDNAKEEAAKLKPSIQAGVDRLGAVPDSAPKSLRVDTPRFVLTNTTGNKLEIVHENALQLDLMMHSKSDQEIFNKLFIRNVEYTLAPTANQLIEHGKLPRGKAEAIRAMFARCFSAKTTQTSLTVESKAAIAERQRLAAEQAEAKRAAKRGGKAAA